jgi:hypothetical protein
MFDHILPKVVSHGVLIPGGRSDEPLHLIRADIAAMLGDLPAVLPVNGRQQSLKVRPEAFALLTTTKLRIQALGQILELPTPSSNIGTSRRRKAITDDGWQHGSTSTLAILQQRTMGALAILANPLPTA